jgi:hypothetical protein
MARSSFDTNDSSYIILRSPDLQEAAMESFDKLASPKYNGEAESGEERDWQVKLHVKIH